MSSRKQTTTIEESMVINTKIHYTEILYLSRDKVPDSVITPFTFFFTKRYDNKVAIRKTGYYNNDKK